MEETWERGVGKGVFGVYVGGRKRNCGEQDYEEIKTGKKFTTL